MVLPGLSVLVLYGSFIPRFEEEHGVTRGEPVSQLSAMMFGEYFPNPGAAGTGEAALALVSPLGAMAVEGVGTGILALAIFALVDRRNTILPLNYLAPVLIGLTVALLISILAALTQGGGTQPATLVPGWCPSSRNGARWLSPGRRAVSKPTSPGRWPAGQWGRRCTNSCSAPQWGAIAPSVGDVPGGRRPVNQQGNKRRDHGHSNRNSRRGFQN